MSLIDYGAEHDEKRPKFKPLLTNSEDEEGDFWDPWDELKIFCGGYSSALDDQAIAVLNGIRAKKYCSDIAAVTGMSAEHVELWQYIFCSADWCEYGTSPRGCFENPASYGLDALIAGWQAYRERHWREDAPDSTPA